VKPFLLVLSSPSGGGKTTIARRLLERRGDLGYSISATTRARRSGEEHGRDYWFLSPEEFERRVAADEFVEHASYNGRRYGTLRSEVDRLFRAGKNVVLDIEVDGARQVRRRFPDAVLVFVLPPSGAELVRRLKGRQTEGPAALRRRMEIASDELSAVAEYDYVVVNDELDRAVEDVDAILSAEIRRATRRDGLATKVDAIRREIQAEAEKLLEDVT
jgi:guanylate kinase